jgi:hypothetical protein
MTFSRRRFRQNRVAFVPPKCAARSFRQKLSLSPYTRKLRGSLLITIGNNGSQPVSVCCSRRLVLHTTQQCVAALSCPGRSAARSGALQTRDRYGPSSWRSRISGAPLHFVTRCTASGTHNSVCRVRSLIHFSNSHSRSRGAFFAPWVCIVASLTRKEGGRSADPPPAPPHVASGCPRLLQRLSFLLLRPPHAASTILK